MIPKASPKASNFLLDNIGNMSYIIIMTHDNTTPTDTKYKNLPPEQIKPEYEYDEYEEYQNLSNEDKKIKNQTIKSYAQGYGDALRAEQNRQDPQPIENENTKTLVHLLHDLLQNPPFYYDEGEENNQNQVTNTLRQQANALNLAFQRLMQDADTLYKHNSNRVTCDPVKYAAAFKAQDQYRRTVKTLHSMKMAENATKKVKKWRSKKPPKND